MSKSWKTVVAAALMAGGVSSVAIADEYVYEPVGKSFAPPPEVWSWTGFYVGGHVGYAWPGVNGFFDADDQNNSLSVLNIDGSFGGVQLGYNYQIQQFVIGIEGDYSWLKNSDSVTFEDGDFDDTVRAEIEYLASIRARLGWAWQNVLLYGTVGWGWTEYEFSNSVPFVPAFGKISLDENGVVYGGGLEVGLTKAVLVRAEYLHYDVGTSSTMTSIPDCGGGPPDCLVRFGDIDVVRGGISFKLY